MEGFTVQHLAPENDPRYRILKEFVNYHTYSKFGLTLPDNSNAPVYICLQKSHRCAVHLHGLRTLKPLKVFGSALRRVGNGQLARRSPSGTRIIHAKFVEAARVAKRKMQNAKCKTATPR